MEHTNTEKLELALHTVTILEAPQVGRNRFCLLIRCKDQLNTDIAIQVTGSINSLTSGKYEVTIPSKPWSKVESKRVKRGYTKRATLDIKEWRTFNCAPQDIANYRYLVSKLCEDYSITTGLFTSSCPWAYFLLGKGPLEDITNQDIFPSTREYDDILL